MTQSPSDRRLFWPLLAASAAALSCAQADAPPRSELTVIIACSPSVFQTGQDVPIVCTVTNTGTVSLPCAEVSGRSVLFEAELPPSVVPKPQWPLMWVSLNDIRDNPPMGKKPIMKALNPGESMTGRLILSAGTAELIEGWFIVATCSAPLRLGNGRYRLHASYYRYGFFEPPPEEHAVPGVQSNQIEFTVAGEEGEDRDAGTP
jgi:hypothetical protein